MPPTRAVDARTGVVVGTWCCAGSVVGCACGDGLWGVGGGASVVVVLFRCLCVCISGTLMFYCPCVYEVCIVCVLDIDCCLGVDQDKLEWWWWWWWWWWDRWQYGVPVPAAPVTNPCVAQNPEWVDLMVPRLLWLKTACPTCYTFPYDDMVSASRVTGVRPCSERSRSSARACHVRQSFTTCVRLRARLLTPSELHIYVQSFGAVYDGTCALVFFALPTLCPCCYRLEEVCNLDRDVQGGNVNTVDYEITFCPTGSALL